MQRSGTEGAMRHKGVSVRRMLGVPREPLRDLSDHEDEGEFVALKMGSDDDETPNAMRHAATVSGGQLRKRATTMKRSSNAVLTINNEAQLLDALRNGIPILLPDQEDEKPKIEKRKTLSVGAPVRGRTRKTTIRIRLPSPSPVRSNSRVPSPLPEIAHAAEASEPKQPRFNPALRILDSDEEEEDEFVDAEGWEDDDSFNFKRRTLRVGATIRSKATTRRIRAPTISVTHHRQDPVDSLEVVPNVVVGNGNAMSSPSPLRRPRSTIRRAGPSTIRRNLNTLSPSTMFLDDISDEEPIFSSASGVSLAPLRAGRLSTRKTMKRATTRRVVGLTETITTSIVVPASEDDSNDEFVDAEGWQDEPDPAATTKTSAKGKLKHVVQQALVSRAFYEVLAARAGEAMHGVGNAAQVISTPLGFVAGPAIAGLVSVGGAAAAAAGQAAVQRFGRKETRRRAQATERAIQSYTASNLILSATKNVAGDEVAEQAHVRALSLSVGAVLDGGMAAGTVTLLASGLAAVVSSAGVSNDEGAAAGDEKGLLQNSYFRAASSAMGMLGNAAPMLPKSMQKVAAAAGTLGTAHQAAMVGAGLETDDEGEPEEDDNFTEEPEALETDEEDDML
ncbi:hypothetical protein BC830DRAFT_1119120 [Chytriomyces sp. MP71]|nr:hypothetical protein BC830DRAFT_1119120 [Chytriomyces sp. MP71]